MLVGQPARWEGTGAVQDMLTSLKYSNMNGVGDQDLTLWFYGPVSQSWTISWSPF